MDLLDNLSDKTKKSGQQIAFLRSENSKTQRYFVKDVCL